MTGPPRAVLRDALRNAADAHLDGTLAPAQATDTACAALAGWIRAEVPTRYGPHPCAGGMALEWFADQLDATPAPAHRTMRQRSR